MTKQTSSARRTVRRNRNSAPVEQKLSYEQKKELKLKAAKEKESQKKLKGDPANKDRFYCTNKELYEELVKWRDSSDKVEDRRISEKFGIMLMQIGDKVLNRSEFRNYPKEVKEDCRSFFFYKALKGLKNYDFRFQSSCFSWLTQCAFNAYLTCLKKYYKHINIKRDLMEKLLAEMEAFPGMNSAASLSKAIKQYVGDDSAD